MMKNMKKRQIILLILIITLNFYIFINKSSEANPSFYPLYSHSESNVINDYILTTSINSRILTWNSFLNLKVSLKNITSGQAIPNSYVYIKAFVNSKVIMKLPISFNYYIVNKYANIENGTVKIEKFISHIPTLFPYTLEVTYDIPGSDETLTSSFYFMILSQREPMISFLTFDMLIIFYLTAFFAFAFFIIINEKISKRNSKEKKNGTK